MMQKVIITTSAVGRIAAVVVHRAYISFGWTAAGRRQAAERLPGAPLRTSASRAEPAASREPYRESVESLGKDVPKR